MRDTPPTITGPVDSAVEADSPLGKMVEFSVSLADVDEDPLQVTWRVDGVAMATNQVTGATATNSFAAIFGVGEHEIEISVTDTHTDPVVHSLHLTVLDSAPPQIVAPPPVAVTTDPGQCSASASRVTLGEPIVSDNVAVSSVMNDAPLIFPKGSTTVTWIATDSSGNKAVSKQIVVVRDAEAPLIISASATPNVLSSPNHQLAQIQVSVAATDNCGVNRSWITSVTSNEPDNGLGDGDTANDIQIAGDLTVLLRAERSGGGSGRIYTITLASQDAAGNLSQPRTITVAVPKGGKSKP